VDNQYLSLRQADKYTNVGKDVTRTTQRLASILEYWRLPSKRVVETGWQFSETISFFWTDL